MNKFHKIFLCYFNLLLPRCNFTYGLPLVLFLWIVTPIGPIYAAEKADLKQTIAWALAHARKIKSVHITAELEQLNHDDAAAAYYPKLNANVGAGVAGSVPKDLDIESPLRTSHAGISLSQSLVDDGSRNLKLKASEAALKKTQIVIKDERDKLSLDVVSMFVELSMATVDRSAKETSLGELQHQAAESLSAVRQGMRPKRDHMRVETELQRQSLAVTVAIDHITDVRGKLCALLGGDASIPESCPEFLPLEPKEDLGFSGKTIPMLDAKKSSLGERFALEAQVLELQANFARDQQKWPTVTLDAVAGYGADDFWGPGRSRVYDLDHGTWSLQLSVTYPLWDAGTSRRKVGAAVFAQELKVLEEADAISDRSTTVAELERTLKHAETTLALNAKILRMDQASYRTTEEDYRQGRASYLELMDVRDKLLQSRVGLAQAYFSALEKYWSHRYYEGTIYEAFEKI